MTNNGEIHRVISGAFEVNGENDLRCLVKIYKNCNNHQTKLPVWTEVLRRVFALPIHGLVNSSGRETDNMSDLPNCVECGSEYTYEDRNMYVCPECSHEWGMHEVVESADAGKVVKDAHGNVLGDGDAVTVIKDLKVKGTSLVVKVGTKVRNIRLVDGDHDIDCKIDGIGSMKLKSEFVKKA
jgi:protein PhnA